MNQPTIEGYGDGQSGMGSMMSSMDYGVDMEDMAQGYEVGEPWDESPDFGVPEYIQLLRDELNQVRAAMQKVQGSEYGMMMGEKMMDPIEEMKRMEACEALWKEESRLQSALQDGIWLLEPLMEPPHNFPSQEKAKKMLHEGMANGQPLSKAQRGLFGLIASGRKPTKTRK